MSVVSLSLPAIDSRSYAQAGGIVDATRRIAPGGRAEPLEPC
jgi:hypothetical protein